jgi:hypothetical protein
VWKSISADDGHVEHGNYAFTVSGKTDCSNDNGSGGGPAASGGDSGGSSFPIIPVVIGVLVLLGLALFVRSRTARS